MSFHSSSCHVAQHVQIYFPGSWLSAPHLLRDWMHQCSLLLDNHFGACQNRCVCAQIWEDSHEYLILWNLFPRTVYQLHHLGSWFHHLYYQNYFAAHLTDPELRLDHFERLYGAHLSDSDSTHLIPCRHLIFPRHCNQQTSFPDWIQSQINHHHPPFSLSNPSAPFPHLEPRGKLLTFQWAKRSNQPQIWNKLPENPLDQSFKRLKKVRKFPELLDRVQVLR